MSVIDRYLAREVLLNWLAVTLVLWLILVSNRLARYLADAAEGELAGGLIFTLLGLKSLNYLVALSPFALFLAVLLAMGRWYADSEMTALAACGVGRNRLYRPVIVLALLAAAILAWLSLSVAPRTAMMGYELQAEAERQTDLNLIKPGRFQELQDGRITLYVERLSQDRSWLQQLFVRGRDDNGLGLITAAQAWSETDPDTNERFLVMEHGHRYQGFPGDADYRVLHFERHGVRIDDGEPEHAQIKRDAVPTLELIGSTDSEDIAELQWRLSVPLAALVLALVAVPLAETTPRRGRYARVLTAVLVFIIYYNLLGTAQVWVKRGVLPPVPGVWWVHLLPLLFAASLVAVAERGFRIRSGGDKA